MKSPHAVPQWCPGRPTSFRPSANFLVVLQQERQGCYLPTLLRTKLCSLCLAYFSCLLLSWGQRLTHSRYQTGYQFPQPSDSQTSEGTHRSHCLKKVPWASFLSCNSVWTPFIIFPPTKCFFLSEGFKGSHVIPCLSYRVLHITVFLKSSQNYGLCLQLSYLEFHRKT